MLHWVTAISDKNTLSNKHLCCTELLRYNRLISVFNTIIFYFVKNIIFYFVKNIFFYLLYIDKLFLSCLIVFENSTEFLVKIKLNE
jgi:hypothetical protein